MDIFDTHCHFESELPEISGALDRAARAGVARIMAVGGSESLNRGAELAQEAAVAAGGRVRVWRAAGWDRDQAGRGDLPPLEAVLGDETGAWPDAVGEIGLDYHYDGAGRERQLDLFGRQLEAARAHGLPVVIHTREADDDTLGLLREIPSRGIIHCFTGGPAFCRALLDLGFMISISGIVTFKAADNVRESALIVPDDRILVETDAPFLAPVPMRGKPNEPAFIVHTVRFLADLRGTPPEDFAALTAANAMRTLGDEPRPRRTV